ncbi:hypothetical protein RSAG8_11416, partial [Rhizoctonia solani AG-8 WAC10335]
MEQSQLKLLNTALHLSVQTGWRGNEINPFVDLIEAISSQDLSLLDRPNGNYRLLGGMPLCHPDSILLAFEARRKLERAEKLPVLPLLTSRDELVEHYQVLYDISAKNSRSDDRSTIRQTVMIQVPAFVRSPLEALSPNLISKMFFNHVHQGSYLIVRAVSLTVRLVAIQVVVEDQEGSAVDLALYNCLETSGLDREGVREIIALGQAMLIREPWITRGRTGGNVTVRVDSPTDIIFLPPSHPLLEHYPESWKLGVKSDALGYKDLGNNAFKNGRFESAIQAYSNGLSIDPSASLLRLNRSLCYLKINKPSMALDDARIASEDEAMTDMLRSKARYRMALAYYALDRFTDALRILEDKTQIQFSPKDISDLEKKTRERLIEQGQGNYNWFALNKIADQIKGHRQIPDVADYVGPVKVDIQISAISGGRGLVTTRDVLAGELLVVSKPFAFACAVEFPELFRAFLARTGAIYERASYEIVGRTMQRLVGDNTPASSLFLDLHSNSATARVSPATDTFPTFLSNGGCCWDIPGEYPIRDIDVNHVEGILASNSFSDRIENSVFGRSEAIYLLPSMVNHACHGTAVRTSVGSIMVMRASRNLKAGEEITCSYVGGIEGASYISRGVALNQWSITCQCELCLADKKDGESRCGDRERYEDELNELRAKLCPGDLEIIKIAKELVIKIQSTYDRKRVGPMDTLAEAQRLSGYLQQVVGPGTAIRLYMDVIRSHGIHVKDTPPKKAPQNHSQLRRGTLIIGTHSFPSQLHKIFQCIKAMVTLSVLEARRGKSSLASHWAVACLWVHEAFYGPGKRLLWYSLKGLIDDDTTHHLVTLLKDFD